MDGEDMIEDLSVDAELDKLDEGVQVAAQKKNPGIPGLGIGDLLSGMPKVFNDDDEFEGVDDYAEEFTDKDGNHVRKEVHKGAGWSSVSIQTSGGSGGAAGPMGGVLGGGADPFGGDIIGQIMAQ